MTFDCWFADFAVKQNILQRTGVAGHSVLKRLLLTLTSILHLLFFFFHVSYKTDPYLSFL